MLYQICYLNTETTEEGKRAFTIDHTALLEADNLRSAYAKLKATTEEEERAIEAHHTATASAKALSKALASGEARSAQFFWEDGVYTQSAERNEIRADALTKYAEAIEEDGEPDETDETETAEGLTLRVYPYCTPTDGEGITALARHALRSFEKWELRNVYAVLEPFRRSEQDREDLTATACTAILEAFAENPSVDMWTLSKQAFNAIGKEQVRHDRNSEREYNPDWHATNIEPLTAKATFPRLNALVKKAIETATEDGTLTVKQATAVDYAYNTGLSVAHTAEAMGVTKRATACTLYSAQYKIALRMLELDPTHRAFSEAGLTADDIAETVATLKKRARVK